MEDKIREIEVHLAEIKLDLKHHIKRTDTLQQMVEPVYKAHLFISYCIKSLIPISILIGIIISVRSGK